LISVVLTSLSFLAAQKSIVVALSPLSSHSRSKRDLTTVSPPSFALENEGVLSSRRRDILSSSTGDRERSEEGKRFVWN